MRAAPLVVALFATVFAAPAVEARHAAPPPEADRIVISVVVYGNDNCPLAQGDEIVVCARKPEGERYRIPKDLRKEVEVTGPQSWSSRVATIEGESRKVIPGSCSPMGSYGQTGCARAALNRWFLERQQDQQQQARP